MKILKTLIVWLDIVYGLVIGITLMGGGDDSLTGLLGLCMIGLTIAITVVAFKNKE